ncbi:MAG: NPCBM/NEW2 domain-containing protein, partial [Clostridia bacterium]|nr:NPCBM/NEW2 domain-containing protein [Clostridia bacterium]
RDITSNEFVELRNLNILNQYGDNYKNVCTLKSTTTSKNILELYVNTSTDVNRENGLNKGSKTSVSAEYKLDGKYNKFAAILKGTNYNGVYLKIYADGKLIYQTESLKGQKDVELDITSVDIIKFEVYSYVGGIGTHSEIRIIDGKLWY